MWVFPLPETAVPPQTVSRTFWGGRGSKAEGRELGSPWANRAQGPISTTCSLFFSWGLIPVSAHLPHRPTAGTGSSLQPLHRDPDPASPP